MKNLKVCSIRKVGKHWSKVLCKAAARCLSCQTQRPEFNPGDTVEGENQHPQIICEFHIWQHTWMWFKNTHTHTPPKSTDKNTAKVSKQESKTSSKAVRVSMACGHKHRTYLTLGLHLVWLLSLSLQKSYFKHQKFPFPSSECLSSLPWQFSIIKKSTIQHVSISSTTYRLLFTVSALTGWS